MPRDRVIAGWLIAVSALIVVMVVYGGWVRLTRSGLSIVEWNLVTGIVPPMGEGAWIEEFDKYRSTPEYQQVNAGISTAQFKAIYYREYIHRLLGRITGLAFVVPLFVFLIKGWLPRRQVPLLLGIGLLFALQGLLGWFMVQSGLVDQPQVSHYRLTLHLLAALALLAACGWLTLDYVAPAPAALKPSRILRRLATAMMALVVLQMAFGALLAGLKAGYVANTFPRMLGQWLPDGTLLAGHPFLLNFLENPITVHFQHRWFGFVVAAVALALFVQGRAEAAAGTLDRRLRLALASLFHLVVLQVVIGVLVVLLSLPPHLASLHQAVAVGIFGTSLFICHQVRANSGVES